jgi:hypothetical protein
MSYPKREELLTKLARLFPNNVEFYNVNGQTLNFQNSIIEILKTKINEVPVFSDEDLNQIYTRFSGNDSRAKLNLMFEADRDIYNLFKELMSDKTVDENFKKTILEVSNNLMRLQYNVILSICNTYSMDTPIIKLVGLINKKIEALNNIYIEKAESEKFKNAMDSMNVEAAPAGNIIASGGARDDDDDDDDDDNEDMEYYKKYLKYKSKYLQRKNKY